MEMFSRQKNAICLICLKFSNYHVSIYTINDKAVLSALWKETKVTVYSSNSGFEEIVVTATENW